MDLLFNRYASPFSLVNNMIRASRFCEFVDEFLRLNNERVRQESLFDIWLHKCFDQGYDEFVSEVEKRERALNPEPIDFIATINNTIDILNSFNPEINDGES